MSYRNERFNKAMRSMDCEIIDPAKNRAVSDKGLGVERMVDAIDYDDEAETARERALRAKREELLFRAEMRLADAGKAYLIRVLLLIVENNYNREKSLKKISRATYFRHREELLRFFCETQVHMDI